MSHSPEQATVMKLTTRGRYAITAALDIVVCGDGQPVKLVDIGSRNGISRLYLEKLFAQLSAHGLVKGARGPAGGYVLTRDAASISVAQVLEVVENLDATSCGGRRNCSAGSACLSHNLWARLNGSVLDFLSGISLRQLADEIYAEIEAGERPLLRLKIIESDPLKNTEQNTEQRGVI